MKTNPPLKNDTQVKSAAIARYNYETKIARTRKFLRKHTENETKSNAPDEPSNNSSLETNFENLKNLYKSTVTFYTGRSVRYGAIS